MYKTYRKQKLPNDCAVIALINSLIFLKKEFSFKPQYAWFKHILKLDETGTNVKHFDKIIKGLFTKVKSKKNPTVSYLQKEIKKKNLVILGAQFDGLNHVGLITKLNSRHAVLVNWGTKYSVERRITRLELEILLYEWSCVWIVNKDV